MKPGLLILLPSLILFASCKKNNVNNSKSTGIYYDIYVVGGTYKTGVGFNNTAACWKNNTLITLNDTSYNGCVGTGIAFNGGDTYMSGFEDNAFEVSNQSEYPVYWKNGVKNTLKTLSEASDVITQANFISVSDNNIYIAGCQSNLSLGEIIWINGVPTAFGTLNSSPSGLCVANGDWYVSVFEPQNSTAAYYKNGVRINLSSGSLNASAQNIYVFGEDVYVVGYTINSAGIYNAVYWKNGVMTTVSSNNSTGGSIYVYNNNIYVGGAENINGNTIATIWKNGVATNVGPPNLNSYCYQVLTINNDVYAVGFETDSSTNSEALLWKNGIATTLGPTPSYAYAIYPKLE